MEDPSLVLRERITAELTYADVSPDAATPSSSGRGGAVRGRGAGRGRGRGAGRRSSRIKNDSEGDSDEEFTMEGTKTKSGRKVHRPTHYDPAQKTPSRRRGPYRRFHDARICKVCQRGNSPSSNMIVFCDGCNSPYHQLCHDPSIDDMYVHAADSEWYCKSCALKRGDKPLATGLVGTGISEEDKKTYLASLPVGHLVQLVLFCENAAPNLALYDPNLKEIVENIKALSAAAQENPEGAALRHNGGNAVVYDENGDMSLDWEELIVLGIAAYNRPEGVQPKLIYDWVTENYSDVATLYNVHLTAPPHLQKALKTGRLLRDPVNHLYRLNPETNEVGQRAALPNVPEVDGEVAPPTVTSITYGVDNFFLYPTAGKGLKLPAEAEDAPELFDDNYVAFSNKLLGEDGNYHIVDYAQKFAGGVANGSALAQIGIQMNA